MSKKIEDYLHLYLECEVMHSHLGLLNMIGITEYTPWLQGKEMPVFRANPNQIKLILRPLNDIIGREHTESSIEYVDGTGIPEDDMNDWYVEWHGEAARTKYLLKQHFDLFGLIESGLAIDATKLKTPQP